MVSGKRNVTNLEFGWFLTFYFDKLKLSLQLFLEMNDFMVKIDYIMFVKGQLVTICKKWLLIYPNLCEIH